MKEKIWHCCHTSQKQTRPKFKNEKSVVVTLFQLLFQLGVATWKNATLILHKLQTFLFIYYYLFILFYFLMYLLFYCFDLQMEGCANIYLCICFFFYYGLK
jgi:hypothetical protein